MAAAIVYEGVGGGGELFRGIKFFLMQRIPTRNHWMSLVKANGGEIVNLEKQADIIIADHARKDAPEGSISWTFIESSIKNGDLQDVENHRAGPATRVVRQVGSALPPRQGRTQFTAEDDRVLMKWCARAERKGLSLKGNEIYQQLEAINNRHTFQSWRDRWIKRISMLPRPEDTEDNDNAEDAEEEDQKDEPGPSRRPVARALPPSSVPRFTARRDLPISRAAKRRPVAEPARSNSPGSSPIPFSPNANPFVQGSVGGNVFSEEETQQLVEVYDDVMSIGDDKQIDAWIAWASKNPNHTAQEWRNYFFEYIVPRMTEGDEPEVPEPQTKAPPKATTKATAKATAKAPGKGLHTVQTIPGPSSSKPGKAEVVEVKDSQGSSGRTLESPKQGKRATDPSLSDEAVFIRELKLTAESFDVAVGDLNPEVCGRRIPLFRLWQVVESDEFGGYDRVTGLKLWPKVARKLNFNDFKHPSAAAALHDVFQEIMVDYEADKMEQWDAEDEASLTESQQMAMIDDQLRQTTDHETQSLEDMGVAEEDEEDDDLDAPQSTPLKPLSSPSGKRSFDTTRQDSMYNKRQRIDKGKGKELEIPSTPEDVINGNPLIRPAFQPSPLSYTSAQPEQVDDGDDGSESERLYIRPPTFQRAISSAAKTRSPARIIEPETQDFHFPPEQEEDTYAADDLTPSPVRSIPKLPDRSRVSDTATHGTTSSSNKNGDSTQSQPESSDLQTRVDGWVQLGYPQDIVIEALEAMSMEPEGTAGDAGHVMEALMYGHGIPEDIAGVWTRRDDEALQRHHPDFGRVVTKHGLQRCKKRKIFLRDQRDVELSLSSIAESADNGGAQS